MKKQLITLAVICASLFGAQSSQAAVSYLGPAGTYSEEATITYFGEQEKIIPAKNVGEALKLVENNTCEYAVIPQENTIGGPVYKYIDMLIKDEKLAVIGEVNLPIRQTLLALPGTKLSDIKTILSHPQGIAQSKDWLKKNLPNAKLVEVASTADGSKQVAAKQDKSVAAIASYCTAKLYKLSIMAENLQYSETNVTRFYVVTKKSDKAVENAHAMIMAKGKAEYLPELLSAITGNGMKLVSVHDRPAKTLLGEYTYVIEVAGNNTAKLSALEKQFAGKMQVKLRGQFNVK